MAKRARQPRESQSNLPGTTGAIPAVERAADEFLASRENLKHDRDELNEREADLIAAMEAAGKTSYQREVAPGDILKIKISASKKRASAKHTTST